SKFPAHTAGRFRLTVTDSPHPLRRGLPAPVAEALHVESKDPSDAQLTLVRTWFRENEVPEYKFIQQQVTELRKQQADLLSKVRTTQVMGELSQPRETFILMRGQYDKHGER